MNNKKTTKKRASTNKSNEETESSLQAALKLLEPLTEFHKTLEDANANDMRFFWDVRLIRGKDTPFGHTKGSSSLPAMLAPKMQGNAPSKIQEEVHDKILRPLMAAMMTEVEKETFEDLAKREQSGDFVSEEESFHNPENEEQSQDESPT